MTVAQRSMERSLLNVTKRDKIQKEVIRSKAKVVRYSKQSAVHERTVGRTYRQNEQHQVGQYNIRVDTQRRKTSKRKTSKEMERQHRGRGRPQRRWRDSIEEEEDLKGDGETASRKLVAVNG